jgi:hypothetical protein
MSVNVLLVATFGIHAHDAVFAKGSVLKAQADRPEKNICAEATAATPRPVPSPLVVSDEEAQAPASASSSPGPAATPHPKQFPDERY